jgi:anti-anti-sigma regulatory factor
MRVTLRQSGLFVMGLEFAGTLLLLLGQLAAGGSSLYLLLLGGAALVFGATLFAYWRGWEPARWIAVAIPTLLVAGGIQEPYITQDIPLSILIPPILGLILTGVTGVIASAGTMLLVLLARAGWSGAYADPVNLVLYAMVFGGMVLSRLVTDTARATAEDHALRAEEARAESASRAHELAEANELLEQQLDQQRQLLGLVTTLETPTLALAEGVLVAPIVGHLDTRRTEALMRRLLADASASRAQLVIMDIAGVAVIDTAVARAVLDTAQALRLLGCEVVLSGISPSVALTLTHLDVSMAGITTVRSPQEALAQWLEASHGRTNNTDGRVPPAATASGE